MNDIRVSEKKNNKKIRITLIISIIILAILLTVVTVLTVLQQPYDRTDNTYTNVTISQGESTEEIADKLVKNGIIGDSSRFVFLSDILNFKGKFQAGKYFLSPCMNYRNIAETLVNGVTTASGYEIPAGLTVEQTAEALDQAGFCSKEEFMKIASEVDFSIFDFIDPDVSGADAIEGYLFPGTYEMSPDANAAMIITTFLNEFGTHFTEEYKARAEESGHSVREILIIASMIEKETSIDKERYAVSAVIHNRLELGMDFDGGFPDKPLCSPGIESIKAALYPEESENTYYVLNKKLDGTHVFTADKDEYKSLKAEYKEACKAKQTEKEKDE